MAGKVRHLHQDSRGRFYARMSIPAELCDALGKRELLKALGGDRQVALRMLLRWSYHVSVPPVGCS